MPTISVSFDHNLCFRANRTTTGENAHEMANLLNIYISFYELIQSGDLREGSLNYFNSAHDRLEELVNEGERNQLEERVREAKKLLSYY